MQNAKRKKVTVLCMQLVYSFSLSLSILSMILFSTLGPRLANVIFAICTPIRAREENSRIRHFQCVYRAYIKSQINPSVIPRRSFQPFRTPDFQPSRFSTKSFSRLGFSRAEKRAREFLCSRCRSADIARPCVSRLCRAKPRGFLIGSS